MKPARKLRTSAEEARASVRIEVLGGDEISSQARAYAEYQVFAALTQITEVSKSDTLVLCFVQSMEGAAVIASPAR